jgi:hypothetical protein
MALRWPLAVVVGPALMLLFMVSGCGHSRKAMRPVYLAPAPAAVTVPNDCPTPAVSPGFEDAGAPSTLAPANPTPPPAGEPPLNQGPADEAPPKATPGPTGSTGEPRLQGPSAALETPRRAVPMAALQARVQPFVNDPNDLFLPPKADRPWRYIVLHHSAHSTGNYAQIDREHRQVLGWQGCGYHFVVGNGSGSPDGQIEVAQRWAEQKGGAHCRNGKTPEINEYGVGICLIGNFDESPPTPRQVEATRALVAYLSDRYHIPSDRVGTHALLASGPTACPGKNFPTTAILGSRGLAVLGER